MKKNLNIAYLNGAEGMIRKSGASSGGSLGGDDKVIYYEVIDGVKTDFEFFRMVKDVSASIKLFIEGVGYIFGKDWGSDGMESNELPYLKAFSFVPIDLDIEEDNQKGYTNFSDFETLCQTFDVPFEQIVKCRITAEEYWERYYEV